MGADMALSDAIPTIISARLIRNLVEESPYLSHVNRMWESELRMYGDEVDINILDPSTISTGNYTPGSTVTYGNPDFGTKVTLELDNTKYWALKLDDVNRQEIRPQLLDEASRLAQREMREDINLTIRTEMLNGAANTNVNGGSDIALPANLASAPKVLEPLLAAAHRHLDIKQVPREGRWMIVGPYTAEYIGSVYAGTDNGVPEAVAQQMFRHGFMRRVEGMDIIVDTVDRATGTSTKTEVAVIGSNYSTAFAQAISKVETLRLETTFADAIRGLYHWGVKTVEQDSFLKATFKVKPAVSFS